MSTAAATTPIDRYNQAAARIAKIRLLQAKLPKELEEAQAEAAQAAEALGSDPLAIVPKRRGRALAPGERYRLVLEALPGRVPDIAAKTGMDGNDVAKVLSKMLNRQPPMVRREGHAGNATKPGYLYHRAEGVE